MVKVVPTQNNGSAEVVSIVREKVTTITCQGSVE